jgi:hypothetical protein
VHAKNPSDRRNLGAASNISMNRRGFFIAYDVYM